ncbi:MAG: bifunctional DNA primase/polymerase [Nitratireductor sp.]|uniref:bifunctional DNA primase/polymerase n=1 Tax=Nitratireductor sp. TaxID=1872084 RepID=UPI0026042385|nr:bifunctional DNA primase/polymerase [Nitratireductor sp.]MCV0350207.1 bifunctional DNA primase/polymerase [Nitratireductor sp.]
MMGIFATEAPRYWALGKPVIPLRVGFKRPWIDAWQVFADRMPTEREQHEWLNLKGEGNIGLPMGSASGIVAIDVDSDDPRVQRVIESVLPASPWKRVGRKGAVYAFRFEGERTFRVKDANGEMLLECLSKGTQIVLPPSIHPDTGRAYSANCDLLEVIGSLPALPRGAEQLLREALKAEGIQLSTTGNTKITSFVPAGARDNALVYNAGLLARAVTRGERTLVEAMGEMKAWVEGYTEKVAGDEVSVEKAQTKVVDFLMRDVTGEKRKALPIGWDDGLTEDDKTKLGLVITDENERWEADRILEFLVTEFERHVSPDTQGWTQAVEVSLDRIARNAELSALDEERLLKFIVSQSKGSYTVTTLRRELAKLRAGEITGTDHSEVARAVVKDLEQFGKLKHHQGRFWQWKGAAWVTVDQNDFIKHISEEYGSLPVCRRFSDISQIVKLMAGLLAEPLQSVNLTGVNFANGFLTEDLELRPHSSEFGCTYVLPYRYQEDSRCPLFMQMLDDSWGEDADYGDKVLALQEALAATLMGVAPRFQRAFCMIGQAHSGKSRILEILKGLMPDGCHSAVPPTDWGDKFMPAQMAEKLVNFAGEISEKRDISGDVFKQVVEGQEIEAQMKNQPIFRFRPKAAQWFASNHTPKTKDTSDGFNRRWLFLEFPRRVPDEKKVIDIDQIVLASEREQIVAWALQALPRLKQNKDYTTPSSHMAIIDEMANANNSVRYFLSQSPRLRVGKREHEGTSKTRTMGDRLFDEYWSFCTMAGGVSRVPRTKFHALMKELAPVFKFEQLKETRNGGYDIAYNYVTVVGMTN